MILAENSKLYFLILDKNTPPETWSQPGKPEWPAFIRVGMSRHRALKLIELLSSQLQDEGRKQVDCTLVGELVKGHEDLA